MSNTQIWFLLITLASVFAVPAFFGLMLFVWDVCKSEDLDEIEVERLEDRIDDLERKLGFKS